MVWCTCAHGVWECVVVTIRCKLLQCFVHVYSVMYINSIWTWTYIYIYIHMGERERERERGTGRERGHVH